MAITNLATLKSELDKWLLRTDLQPYYDPSIELLEAYLNQKLRHRNQQVRATTNLPPNTEYMLLPEDLLEIDSVFIDSTTTTRGTHLRYVSQNQILNIKNNINNNDTKYYSIIGVELWIWPLSSTSQVISIIYWRKLPSILLVSNQYTNWLLTQYPNVYLWGTMKYLYGLIKSNELEAKYTALLEQEIAQLNAQFNKNVLENESLEIIPDYRIY